MRKHDFGGTWTDLKIDLVRRYIDAYTTALKNQKFRLMYVDAFAGTGYRSSRGDDPTLGRLPGFSKIDELVKGSARVAVEVSDRPFDEFVFIEKHATRYKGLTGLRKEFPEHADRMRFLNEDANAAIMTLCHETDWRRTRAVMFLDPCGMQV